MAAEFHPFDGDAGGAGERARVRPKLEWLEDRIVPAPMNLVVTSATDDGSGKAGTLSAAIMTADMPGNAGSTIVFAIGQQGNPATISVTGALPKITQAVMISGYTQGMPNPTPGTPYVELKGPGPTVKNQNGVIDGLEVAAGGVQIFGLAIDNFSGSGISLEDEDVGQGDGDTIDGCYIGTDLSGTNANVGNAVDGVIIVGSNNTIGGTSSYSGNFISGNGGSGIDILSNTGVLNLVEGNTIGLDKTLVTALPNKSNGVRLFGGAADNSIGNTYSGGNIISGNGQNGVLISDASNNIVAGNNIGVTFDGVTAKANGANGVQLDSDASGNVIGGNNEIGGNIGDGVLLTSPDQQNFNAENVISSNFIGIGSDGSTRVANGGKGIEISSVIGTGIYNNYISGNWGDGIDIMGDTVNNTVIATKTLVEGNVIGLNGAGTAAMGNYNGIYIYLADQNTIGGTSSGLRNFISGNGQFGIEVGGSFNLVVNNYIGTDSTGSIAIANGHGGVNIGYNKGINIPQTVVATDNTIGGTLGESTRNVISGNRGANPDEGSGISLWGSGVTDTLIEGNYIGVDASGMNPLGNKYNGVLIDSINGGLMAPTDTTIGGAGAGAGNVISANGAWGVIAYTGTTGLLQNNTIGYDVTGADTTGGKLKNQSGEDSLAAGWTSMGNKEQ